MKSVTSLFFLVTILSLALNGCGQGPSTTATPAVPTPTTAPQGKTIVVTDTANSGPSTLRQALLDAQYGDTITFDPVVFPPEDPATILLNNELPGIQQGNLTIDASNAGVILDGTNISSSTAYGLQLYSDWNTIQGLQMVNFAEGGIVVGGRGQYNTIGGDRSIGAGPIGQANLIGGSNLGIGIWDEGTSFNTVTGNLIGMDPGGETANGNNIGIAITDGAKRNMIGPGNVIANNNDYGITINHPTSLHNTITQNSIYSNGEADIYLSGGGNGELTPPFIIDYDLTTDTIAGSACPNCIVEVFSGDSGAGKMYEGQTTADETGVFTFKIGVAFTGPNLTATATNEDGNSSGFSTPTSGTSWSIALQSGNYLPMIPLQPKESQELENNHLGDLISLILQPHPEHPYYESSSSIVDRINAHGLKWMRVSLDWFDWIEVEESGEYSKYYIDPSQDEAISGLSDHGISVLYTLVYWDEEINTVENYSRFQTKDEVQRYLDFVQFIVSHFKGRVEYYALLNEPDIGHGTQQYVESADYINLVRRTVPVIRQADPEAKIIIGEVTPLTDTSSIEYLFDIIRSDVLPLVDGISWHAEGGASPEYMAEEYYNYQSLLSEIRNVATANGFIGEFWATEMHWRTSESTHSSEYDEYSGIAAAKYLARGIVMHRGMGFTSGLAENLEHINKMPVIQNLSTLLAGAEPFVLPVDIQSDAPLIARYNFILPNRDRLVAIWSDGIAIEKDPGASSTVVIQGVSTEKIIGIDILTSIEQELIFSVEDGNLVIRNLLIRDYPIFLRLQGVREVVSER